MTDHPIDRTTEDELVTHVLEELPGLKQFADGPELTFALGGDMDLIAEYGYDIVPLDEFEGSDWYAHVQDIISWAEEAGVFVSVDSELAASDLPNRGRAVVNVTPQFESSPLALNVFCEADGRVTVKIRAEPLDPMYASHIVYDGSVRDMDVENVRAAVNQHRPFVTGRARELLYEAGVKASHARAIALREAGLTHEEVGERLGITKGASGSYQSKFNNSVRESEHLFIARTPVPRRVLAKHSFDRTNYSEERWYVCEDMSPDEATDAPITVSIVKGDHTRDGASLDVSTTGFSSLRSCIESFYTEASLPDKTLAEERRKLFANLPKARLRDAGFETLPSVRDD